MKAPFRQARQSSHLSTGSGDDILVFLRADRTEYLDRLVRSNVASMAYVHEISAQRGSNGSGSSGGGRSGGGGGGGGGGGW